MPGDRRYRFVQVDVFSERAFAGNQLAVVFDADDLSGAEMQDIALARDAVRGASHGRHGVGARDLRAPRFIWMRHRDATLDAEVDDRDGVATALGLKGDDLLPALARDPARHPRHHRPGLRPRHEHQGGRRRRRRLVRTDP